MDNLKNNRKRNARRLPGIVGFMFFFKITLQIRVICSNGPVKNAAKMLNHFLHLAIASCIFWIKESFFASFAACSPFSYNSNAVFISPCSAKELPDLR